MIVTVTGGRFFEDRQFVFYILDGLHSSGRITTLRHGGVVRRNVLTGVDIGTDNFADQWSRARQVPAQVFLPDWESLGKRAGPKRNRDMLAAEPLCDGVVAFPGGAGTDDCVKVARKAGFPVFDAAALYVQYKNRPKSFGESMVEATFALMDQMQADGADQGVLKLDMTRNQTNQPLSDPGRPNGALE